MFELQRGPGNELSISANWRPDRSIVYSPLESCHDRVAVGFGVELVAHLDEQSHVLICAEAGIQAELCLDRFRVGGIVLLKAEQTLGQVSQLALLVAQLRHGLV